MMSASTIFGEGGFVFNFVSYGLMTKPHGVGCPMYVNPFFFSKQKDFTKHKRKRKQPCS